MNSLELLCRLTHSQVDRLFAAAKSIPADKLDWKPGPGARSALDQIQEVATAVDQFWSVFLDKRVDWSPEKFQKWMEERAQITCLEQAEAVCREQTKRLTEFVMALPESALDDPVETPVPGFDRYADVLAYHLWNAGYHEGQINYIASLLASD